MKRSFLLIERIVIESISKGSTSYEEILKDTELDRRFLVNILDALTEAGVLKRSENRFLLDRNLLKEYSQKESLQNEVKELFISWVNRYFQEEIKETCLKMQKVYLTPSEEVIYNELLRKLGDFVSGVKKSSKEHAHKISKQKVIFWGHSQYSSLVDSSIHAL